MATEQAVSNTITAPSSTATAHNLTLTATVSSPNVNLLASFTAQNNSSSPVLRFYRRLAGGSSAFTLILTGSVSGAATSATYSDPLSNLVAGSIYEYKVEIDFA
jgi:hypothetical protein